MRVRLVLLGCCAQLLGAGCDETRTVDPAELAGSDVAVVRRAASDASPPPDPADAADARAGDGGVGDGDAIDE